MLRSYSVSVSLSLGNPPAFASGLGVWWVKPCCDTGGVNAQLLFCTQSKESKLIHALFSGFTTSEVLLHLGRLHLIPLCLVPKMSLTPHAGVCAHCSASTSLGLFRALLKPVKREERTPEFTLLQDKSCTINAESLWRQQSPGEWCKQVESALCLSVCLSSTAPGSSLGGRAEGVDSAEEL